MPDKFDSEANAQPARSNWLTELIAVLILSIAALLSAYSTFQAELWDGEQASHYTRAEQARTAASNAKAIAVQLESADAMLFAQWANAYGRGEDDLERFYRSRFRPVFREPFERWLATEPRDNPKALPSPFSMPGYDRRAKLDAQRIESKANQLYEAGERANDISDAYGQANVILALALFLGGIVQAFNAFKLRVVLLSVATISVLIGISKIAMLPAIRLV